MNLTEEDIAYIAGVLDSRGSILLWKNPKERHKQPVIRMTVVNRRKAILDFLKEKLGGDVSKYDSKRHYYQIRGAKAIEVLGKLQPLFKTHRRINQCNLLLKEYEKINYAWGNNAYYANEVRSRNKLVKKFGHC